MHKYLPSKFFLWQFCSQINFIFINLIRGISFVEFFRLKMEIWWHLSGHIFCRFAKSSAKLSCASSGVCTWGGIRFWPSYPGSCFCVAIVSHTITSALTKLTQCSKFNLKDDLSMHPLLSALDCNKCGAKGFGFYPLPLTVNEMSSLL